MKHWLQWLPGVDTFRRYEATWLPHDIFAGLVLATMLVPVGIAYAAASGLPGIHGLYATIVPLLAYAVFGPSRIIVLGPDSALAAVILGVVMPLAGGDPGRAATLAAMMALVSGTVLILAGLARLGFVTELLSKPIRYGYINGIALTVLISQLPKLLGFSIESEGPLRDLWAIARAIHDGKTNWVAFAVGLGTLIGYTDLVPVLIGGCAIALVSFADTSVLSRTYAARLGDDVDPNQEMVGLGAANLATGFFQGFPISSSSSRTPVAET